MGLTTPCLPRITQRNRPAVREHQRRQHDVGVEHNARHAGYFVRAFGFLDHATASTMSCSAMSSSASLARTASARWMRTGVRMIWPPWAFTSKYSTAPTALVTLLGSVSWFLEVSLASMGFRHLRKVRIPYFSRILTWTQERSGA